MAVRWKTSFFGGSEWSGWDQGASVWPCRRQTICTQGQFGDLKSGWDRGAKRVYTCRVMHLQGRRPTFEEISRRSRVSFFAEAPAAYCRLEKQKKYIYAQKLFFFFLPRRWVVVVSLPRHRTKMLVCCCLLDRLRPTITYATAAPPSHHHSLLVTWRVVICKSYVLLYFARIATFPRLCAQPNRRWLYIVPKHKIRTASEGREERNRAAAGGMQRKFRRHEIQKIDRGAV